MEFLLKPYRPLRECFTPTSRLLFVYIFICMYHPNISDQRNFVVVVVAIVFFFNASAILTVRNKWKLESKKNKIKNYYPGPVKT